VGLMVRATEFEPERPRRCNGELGCQLAASDRNECGKPKEFSGVMKAAEHVDESNAKNGSSDRGHSGNCEDYE
jgi:hypothetical protein